MGIAQQTTLIEAMRGIAQHTMLIEAVRGITQHTMDIEAVRVITQAQHTTDIEDDINNTSRGC